MKESILRTLVPIVYALLLKANVGDWLGIDDTLVQNAAALIGAGLVYVAVRLLEQAGSSRWGWLIGYPKAPSYDQEG